MNRATRDRFEIARIGMDLPMCEFSSPESDLTWRFDDRCRRWFYRNDVVDTWWLSHTPPDALLVPDFQWASGPGVIPLEWDIVSRPEDADQRGDLSLGIFIVPPCDDTIVLPLDLDFREKIEAYGAFIGWVRLNRERAERELRRRKQA